MGHQSRAGQQKRPQAGFLWLAAATALGLALSDDLFVRAASGSGAGPEAITDPNPITLAIKWLQGQGHVGALAVCVLLALGWVLSQAGNLEKVAGWFGLKRKQPPASGVDVASSVPPGVHQSATAGRNVNQVAGDQNIHLPPPPEPKLPAGRSPSNLPADTECLVARQGELELLARELVVPGKEVMIHGMPGVGKSALALRFAAQSSGLFPGGVLRLEAAEGFSAMAAKAVAAVEDLFADLRLGEEDLPLERKLRRCWQRWPGDESQGVLVVVDDLPAAGPQSDTTLKELREFMPKRFRRLITQRHRPLSGVSIDLGVLPDGASGLELLSLRAGVSGAERIQREEAAGLRLVDRVGRLPLALVLLAGRLQRVPTLTLAQLEADLEEKAIEAEAFLQEHAELLASKGMVETFLSSWQALTEDGKSLARLLTLALPGAIPWELVERSRRADQPLVEGSAWTRGLADLVGAHLIEGPTEEQGRQVVRLHPLSRDFLQRQVKQEGWAEESVWRQQLEHSARALMTERGGEEVGFGRQARALAPDDGWLCCSLGRALMRRGQLVDAGEEFIQARILGTQQENKSLIIGSWNGTGDALLAQGNGPGALSAYQTCLDISVVLVQQDPSNTEWQFNLSVCHERIGNVLKGQGDSPGALKAWEKCLEITKALTILNPTNTKWQLALSIGYDRIGDALLIQGDHTKALNAYLDAQSITTCLASEDESNMMLQRELCVIMSKVNDVLFTVQGVSSEALMLVKHTLEKIKSLVERDPTNSLLQRDLSIQYQVFGDMVLAQGDLTGALMAYKEGLAIIENLIELDANNMEWQHDLFVFMGKFGGVLVAQGNLTGAMMAYKQGLAIIQALVQLDSNNKQWQCNLSIQHQLIGDVMLAQGKRTEALADYQAGLVIMKTLVQLDLANKEWQRSLSVIQSRLGDVLLAQGNLTGSLEAYQESFVVTDALVQLDSNNTEWHRDLYIRQSKVGDVLSAQGDSPAALKCYQQVLKATEDIARLNPADPQLQSDLAIAQERVGDMLDKNGDRPGALKAFRAGLLIREVLVQQDPSNTQWQSDLARSEKRIGDVLMKQGDGTGALKAYQAGLLIGEALVQQDPSNTQWQVDVAVFCGKLSSLGSMLSITIRREYLLRGRQVLVKLKDVGRLHSNQDMIGSFDQALQDLQ